MSDKTEQTMADELRLAAKSAAPYAMAMIGANHLDEIADTIDTLRTQLAEAHAALKTVMRNAELSKEPCGPDPESPAAVRNAKFASLSSIAAQGLGMVSGPSLTEHLVKAQRDAERWRWLKDHARIFRQSPDMSGNHYWMVQTTTTLRGPTLDAAIDAAKGESDERA